MRSLMAVAAAAPLGFAKFAPPLSPPLPALDDPPERMWGHNGLLA